MDWRQAERKLSAFVLVFRSWKFNLARKAPTTVGPINNIGSLRSTLSGPEKFMSKVASGTSSKKPGPPTLSFDKQLISERRDPKLNPLTPTARGRATFRQSR
jgi:hypothetical protein